MSILPFSERQIPAVEERLPTFRAREADDLLLADVEAEVPGRGVLHGVAEVVSAGRVEPQGPCDGPVLSLPPPGCVLR